MIRNSAHKIDTLTHIEIDKLAMVKNSIWTLYQFKVFEMLTENGKNRINFSRTAIKSPSRTVALIKFPNTIPHFYVFFYVFTESRFLEINTKNLRN